MRAMSGGACPCVATLTSARYRPPILSLERFSPATSVWQGGASMRTIRTRCERSSSCRVGRRRVRAPEQAASRQAPLRPGAAGSDPARRIARSSIATASPATTSGCAPAGWRSTTSTSHRRRRPRGDLGKGAAQDPRGPDAAGRAPAARRRRPRRVHVARSRPPLERAADAAPNPGRPTVHRLNRTEYTNSIRDLLALEIDAPDAAAGRRHRRARLRQQRRRADGLAGARRALSVGGAQDQPARRRPDARADDHRDLPSAAAAGPGRPPRRAPAVRFARRHGRSSTTSRLDGEYVVKIRLQTNNYDYVKGLADPHDLEVRVDRRARQGLHGRRHEGGRAPGELRRHALRQPRVGEVRAAGARRPRSARSRSRPDGTCSASRSSRKSWEPEDVAAAAARAAGRCRATRCSTRIPGVDSGHRRRPVRRRRPGDTPSRRRIFTCQPRGGRRRGVRADDSLDPRAPRLSPAAHRQRRRGRCSSSTTRGRARRRLRGGHPTGAGADPGQPRLPVPDRAGPDRRRRPGTASTASATSSWPSRLSFFLWSSIPDDELLDAAARGTAEGSGGARAAGPAHAGRSALEGARRQLRRPVAACCATSATSSPDPDLFPDFDENLRDAFQRETELFLESQLREDRSVVELLTRQLHVRQRAAGAALRHPERLRQPLPPGHADRRAGAAACSARAAC